MIAKERAQALAKRVVKADREPREVDETEPPIVALPETWCWVRVKQLASSVPSAITDGPFGTNLMTKDYIGAPGFKVVRLGNIGVGHYIEGKDAFITAEHYRRLPRHHVESGDLLVAGLAEPVCRACIAPAEMGPHSSDEYFGRSGKSPRRTSLPDGGPQLKHLSAAGRSGESRHYSHKNQFGEFQGGMGSSPPLAEQRRIDARRSTSSWPSATPWKPGSVGRSRLPRSWPRRWSRSWWRSPMSPAPVGRLIEEKGRGRDAYDHA